MCVWKKKPFLLIMQAQFHMVITPRDKDQTWLLLFFFLFFIGQLEQNENHENIKVAQERREVFDK